MSRASMPFQKERQLDKNAKSPSARADLLPVFPERQSFVIPDKGRLAGIVVLLPQVPIGDLTSSAFPEPCQKLANARISCCNIRNNRI
jgi:hypothetical protein